VEINFGSIGIIAENEKDKNDPLVQLLLKLGNGGKICLEDYKLTEIRRNKFEITCLFLVDRIKPLTPSMRE
jgi:hypothetical protein